MTDKMAKIISLETDKLISVIPIIIPNDDGNLKCASSCENTNNSSDLLVHYTTVSFVSQDIC